MHQTKVRSRSGLGASMILSGCSAVAGWSVSTGGEIGIGAAVAAAVAALVTTAWLRPETIGHHDIDVTDRHGGWLEVQRELDRSRRHARPFVLIRIPCSRTGAAGNGHAPGTAVSTALAESLRPFLRSVDSVWTEESNVYLLLPESRRAMGEALMDRVRRAAPNLMPGAEQLVAFPEDGVTGGALISLLHGNAVSRHSIPLTPDPNRIRETS